MKIKRGFNKQHWLNGECGQYSLVHALTLLGIPIDIDDAHYGQERNNFMSTFIGTDGRNMKKGIRYFECKALEYNPEYSINNDLRKKLKNSIDSLIKKHYPVIISINGFNHWVVIAGKLNDNTYVWIDSATNGIIGSYSWEELEEEMCVQYEDYCEYYYIGVQPKLQGKIKHSMVSEKSNLLEILNESNLNNYWGNYLYNLSLVFDYPYKNNKSIPARLFIERNKKSLIDLLDFYLDNSNKKVIERKLSNYKKVAGAHNFFLPRGKEKEVLVGLSIMLTMDLEEQI